MELFFYHLVEQGVFIWEGRTAFLSTAHTDEDIEFMIGAFERTIEEMRAGGFLPEGIPPGTRRTVGWASQSAGVGRCIRRETFNFRFAKGPGGCPSRSGCSPSHSSYGSPETTLGAGSDG